MTHKLVIIGAGKGGASLIRLFNEDKDIKIIGVADINKKASGLKVAKEYKIPITYDPLTLISRKDINVIVDVTNSKDFGREIFKHKKPDVEVLGGKSAYFFWKLVEERKKQKEKYEALYQIGLMLALGEKKKDLLKTIVKEATKKTNTPAGSLALYDKQKKEFYLVASKGFSEKFSKIKWKLRDHGLTNCILKRKIPLVIENVHKESDFDNRNMLTEKIESLIALPLIGQKEEIVGILYVDDFKARRYTYDEISFLSLLGTKASIAIQKIQLLEELVKTKNYLENLFKGCPDAIITTDENKNINLFNPAAEEMLEYKSSQIYGKSVTLLYENLEKAKEVGKALREGDGSLKNFEIQLKTKKGKLIPVLISVSSLKDEKDNLIGTVGFSKDITTRKQLEDEHLKKRLELEKAYDEMIKDKALISLGRTTRGFLHDSRDLLNSIYSDISILIDHFFEKTEKKDIKDQFDSLTRKTDLLKAYFEKLVDYSKIKKFELKFNNLYEIIKETIFLLSYRLEERKIDYHVNCNKKLKIYCDKEHIERVFINLILNSIFAIEKSSRKSKGEIKIEAREIDKTWVGIKITDNGTGIKKEYYEKIFEPFHTSKGLRGKGLGLAVCKQIIEEFNKGRIYLKSNFGFETTFFIELPKNPI